jgi:DNA-binding Lrp family transcriptional regulator
MLCIMHEAEPYGHLLVNGKPVTIHQLAKLSGIDPRSCSRLVAELQQSGVLSVTETQVIFSRRMVRDFEKAKRDQENGAKGGNPKIVFVVNPEDKAQIPDTRSQIKKDIRSVSKETRPSPTVLQFDSFKKAYPKRGASNPWQPALKLFVAAVKRGEDPESIIRAASGYRAECDTLKTTATDKVAQAQTWLRQERWRDYLDGTEADADRRANYAAAEAKGWRLVGGAWVKPDETAIGG